MCPKGMAQLLYHHRGRSGLQCEITCRRHRVELRQPTCDVMHPQALFSLVNSFLGTLVEAGRQENRIFRRYTVRLRRRSAIPLITRILLPSSLRERSCTAFLALCRCGIAVPSKHDVAQIACCEEPTQDFRRFLGPVGATGCSKD